MHSIGKIARASFVMAFVKRDEISQFLIQKQPSRAIARFYDRNPATVERAIGLLRRFEHEVATGAIASVAQEVWHNRLGWERSQSFLEAKAYIDRGEMMPKETCGPKRRVRRKHPAGQPGAAARQSPAPSGLDGSAKTPMAPAPAGDEDTLLDEISEAALLRQGRKVAQDQKRPSPTSSTP